MTGLQGGRQVASFVGEKHLRWSIVWDRSSGAQTPGDSARFVDNMCSMAISVSNIRIKVQSADMYVNGHAHDTTFSLPALGYGYGGDQSALLIATRVCVDVDDDVQINKYVAGRVGRVVIISYAGYGRVGEREMMVTGRGAERGKKSRSKGKTRRWR